MQWHNLAIEIQNNLQLPTLVIWYEDYETKFNQTVGNIFDFLSLPKHGDVISFIPGKSYEDFFTDSEKRAAMLLVKRVADPGTWDIVKRYASM